MTSASKDRLNLRAQALAYARRGWPVFPIAPREKTPLTTNGFKDAVPRDGIAGRQAEDVINAWWAWQPEANIGLATGHSFDVLDLDGPEGYTTFLTYLHEHDAEGYIHAGPVSLTGKGYHLLIQPTGSGNRANLAGSTIDYRGLGGYIVAPPSLHPLGHRYRWDETRGRDENATLPEAPAWLTGLLGEEGDRAAKAAYRGIKRNFGPAELRQTIVTASGKIAMGRPSILLVVRHLNLYTVRQGTHWFARCPFHKGYDAAQLHEGTPSMQLDEGKNNFYCHNCRAYGDSIDLQNRQDINGQSF